MYLYRVTGSQIGHVSPGFQNLIYVTDSVCYSYLVNFGTRHPQPHPHPSNQEHPL